MLRCTYRLTVSRTVVTRGKLNRLPHKGDVLTLNNEQYVVDKVQQEGASVTISVSVQVTNSTSISNKN